ncbi:mitochondrial transcription factor B2 [Brevipalpus obovatus]|uniref:mitochondrial transcription factor B2 n=1 Tax=Brevipalpus obovatus TaxID=246614 RepID=UPI003D9F1B35
MFPQLRPILSVSALRAPCWYSCVRKFISPPENGLPNKRNDFSFRVHVIGNPVIDFVVKNISPDLRSDRSVIMEVNPGPGFILEALLKAGARRVFGLYEESSPYLSALEALREKYPDRLQIRPMEVLFLEKITEQSTINGVTLRSMLDLPADFPGYNWTDDPPFKVLVTLTKLTEKTFFRRIFKELVLQDGFFSIGRPQIFAFVTGYQYHLLLPQMKIMGGSSFNSLFAQTFFDIECLGKFDWSNFHPPAKLPKKAVRDTQSAFLLSLTPKADLPDKFPAQHWPEFMEFLRFSIRRKERIIPFMEHMLPDCGPRLIKIGFRVCQTFRDLEPSDHVKLFREIMSWPDYESSNLASIFRERLVL